MTFDAIEAEYRNLENCILDLEIHYLEPHIHEITPSEKAILDMKAFVVLCHASFENFAEELSLALMIETIDQFVNYKRVSFTLVALFHFYAKPKQLDDFNGIYYDYIRNQLIEIKQDFSNAIHDNHGVGIKYLKKLFIPLGIDLPKDATLNSSLKSLVDNRGEFAHHSAMRTRNIPDPNNLIQLADDSCLLLKMISEEVKRSMFYPWKQLK